MRATDHQPDRGYRLIIAGVAGISLWLIAMPFCPFIQRTTLNRFHLQAPGFAVWAIQAPVPAMYNFHNRYRIEAPPQNPPLRGTPLTGTVNHFPIRQYTFGETRSFMLRDRSRHLLTAQSRYRHQTLTTRWLVVPTGDGRFELIDEVVP